MKDEMEQNGSGNLDSPSELGGLFLRPPVPEHLEDRIARSLTNTGVITRPVDQRTLRRIVMWRIAAGLVLFIAGFGSALILKGGGERAALASAEPVRRYALLLYPGSRDDPEVDDVAANRSWARSLVAAGREVSGEKLKSGGIVVSDPAAASAAVIQDPADLQGFFVISAASDAEAVSIARSSPHFRNGGRIVVTLIEPT